VHHGLVLGYGGARARPDAEVIIALASPRVAATPDEGLDKIERFLSEAAAQGAEVVCFPEAYLPGLRGQDFDVLPFDRTQEERVLRAVAQWARGYAVATIWSRPSRPRRQPVWWLLATPPSVIGNPARSERS